MEWWGQGGSNSRPSGPKADALPDCAMPRRGENHTEASGAPPDRRAAGLVFEQHSFGGELIADAIGLGPVLRAPRRGAKRDALLDLPIGKARGGGRGRLPARRRGAAAGEPDPLGGLAGPDAERGA